MKYSSRSAFGLEIIPDAHHLTHCTILLLILVTSLKDLSPWLPSSYQAIAAILAHVQAQQCKGKRCPGGSLEE